MITKRLKAPPAVQVAKVKLTKGVILGPGQIGEAGEIYELPKHKATELVHSGLAEYTDEGDPAEGEDAGAEKHRQGYETATVEEPTSRDPKPKKRG